MSFFWFHDKTINKYLRAKFKDPALHLNDFGSDQYKKLVQINLCFSRDPWGVLHDITGHVAHPFAIKTKHAYHYIEENRSFGDLCLDTAAAISHMTDRRIALFWSGGIDSTAALVAMMQTVEPERLAVVCNQASIEEFPSLYDQKIKDRIQVLAPATVHRNFKDFFCVGGDGGDTVWAAIDNSFWDRDSLRMRKPWQDCVDSANVDMDFVEQFCSWSEVPITSWVDLRTWFYTCCKSQDKCMRPYYLRQGITNHDAVAFYDVDTSFRYWTMSNLHNIIGNRWEDYKIPAKQFIYQYHKDRDYLENKSKVNSAYLDPDLKTKDLAYFRFVVADDFSDYPFSSWPFMDYAEFEDFNDVYGLVPSQYLDGSWRPHSQA